MDTALTIILWIAGAGILYLALGHLLHRLVFPEPRVELSGYFKPGDTFSSSMEGLRQTIVSHQGGRVFCRIELEPHAPGPPVHLHRTFDETFVVKEGTLSLLVAGKTHELGAGEQFTVRRGIPHKPFNASGQPVIGEIGEPGFPEAFAVYLSQMYRFLDEDQRNQKPPRMLLQMSLFSRHLDSLLGEGPPPALQRALFLVLAPAARALGYRSFYEHYRV